MKVEIKNLNCNGTPRVFHEFAMNDSIRDFNHTLELGKIFGLVGSLGSGGWLLSYLLAGKDPLFNYQMEISHSLITIDGLPANNELLKNISCYIGEGVSEIPYRKYSNYPLTLTWKIRGIKTVADQIQEGISRTENSLTLQEIVNLFDLTGLNEPGRLFTPLEFNSGERWRASLAIGFAFQKKLYCTPWIEPYGIEYILGNYGRKYLNIIRDSGASVIIPVSSGKYVAQIADEIIYLKEIEIRI